MPEPKTSCRIQVGNNTPYWEEGKSLFFDDSHIHQVWNDTADDRVILFMDIMRPFQFPMSVINLFLIKLGRVTPFVQQAKTQSEFVGQRIKEFVKRF